MLNIHMAPNGVVEVRVGCVNIYTIRAAVGSLPVGAVTTGEDGYTIASKLVEGIENGFGEYTAWLCCGTR